MTSIFKKNMLPNGVTIMIVGEDILDYDLIIKFKNYGSSLDKYSNIYGFQHLLEHAIFYICKDLNMNYNAHTSANYMSIVLNLPTYSSNFRSDPLSYLKTWLFQKNNFNKIDISRKVTLEAVEEYINELDSEFLYRDTLNIPWDLQLFLLSGGKCHYIGGNKETFSDKASKIKSALAKPLPISPDEIVIYLDKRQKNYLPLITQLFSQLEPIKKPTYNLMFEPEKFQNKIVQLNNGVTNNLTFLIKKHYFHKLFKDIEILHAVKLFFPFFRFDYTIADCIFICFDFENIEQLYSFSNLLEYQEIYNFRFDDNKKPIFELNYYDLENISYDFFNLLNRNLKFSQLFEYYKKPFIDFLILLSNEIRNKRHIINLTKSYITNSTTQFHEKYNLFDINFDSNYFFNKFDLNYYYNYDYNNYNKHIVKAKETTLIPCFSGCEIKRNLNLRSRPFNKKEIIDYKEGIINFFLYPEILSLQESLDKLSFFNMKVNKPYDVKIKSKIYNIQTEFKFLFCVMKIQKNQKSEVKLTVSNIEERLKEKGLSYFLSQETRPIGDNYLVFLNTITDEKQFKPIQHIIENEMSTKFKKIEMAFVFSTVSKNSINKININSMTKKLKVDFN